MPLNSREQAAFDALTAEIAADDPGFDTRTSLPHGPANRAIAVAAAVGGMSTLPVAIETGVYPLGLVGFLIAVVALYRLLCPPAGVPASPGSDAVIPTVTRPAEDPGRPRTDPGMIFLRWQLVIGGVAVLFHVLGSSG
jgi:hypothetical protein